MTNNTQQETDFTLRTDFQHDDNSTPPSGTLRSDAIRGIVITAIAAVVAVVLNNIYLLSHWPIKAWHWQHSLAFCG